MKKEGFEAAMFKNSSFGRILFHLVFVEVCVNIDLHIKKVISLLNLSVQVGVDIFFWFLITVEFQSSVPIGSEEVVFEGEEIQRKTSKEESVLTEEGPELGKDISGGNTSQAALATTLENTHKN